MIRLPLIALASLLTAGAFATAAMADDVAPLAGKSIALEAATGVVYYTEEEDGFRVVATLSASEGAAPLRFTATLSDGESLTVSVPVAIGQADRAIEISRDGQTLTVEEAEPLMVRASLD